MKSNSIQNNDDHLQGGDGEDHVQLPPEKHVEEGEYQVQVSRSGAGPAATCIAPS